jgi:competence protein ComEC
LNKEILIFVIFFAAGIFFGSFVAFSFFFGVFLVCLGFILGGLFYFLKPERLILVSALVFMAVGLGLFWYGFRERRSIETSLFLERFAGQKIQLLGVVSDEPEQRENYTRFVLATKEGARVLIYADHYPIFRYGDEIKAKGVLNRPKQLSEFDWPAYLARENIFYEMHRPKIELLSSSKGSWVKRNLFFLKERYLEGLSRLIPEPHSALLGGLTVGARRGMPTELLEKFRKTGIIHIVVLSGYNVTIVGYAIARFFSFLPSFFGGLAGIFGVILFAVMTGGSPTVVRASLMATFVILARQTGRVYQAVGGLLVAGFLMLLYNPKILRFDSSFQLSFLATLALIYLVPILKPRLKIFSEKLGVREIASATIATQIFVMPMILYKTGLFPLVSLPVNLLILLVVPLTMFLGFITGGLAFLSPILAAPFGWFSWLFLEYQLKIVEIFSGLPFSSLRISHFPLWLMLLVYSGYFVFIVKTRGLPKPQDD